MNQRINLSKTAIVLTAIILLLVAVFTAISFKQQEWAKAYTLAGVAAIVIAAALLFSPISSGADDDFVYVRHPLRTSRYAMSRIVSAEPFVPTMAEKCVVGSRGFMGYWGFFYDGGVQKYVACYGRGSECVLLTLDNGRKYLIGAHEKEAFADYINSKRKQAINIS